MESPTDLESEPFLNTRHIPRQHLFQPFRCGRKLRAFSSIAETHSGYLFE